MKRILGLSFLVLAGAGLLSSGCERKVDLFCDEDSPCTDPALPFCDLTGAYEASDFVNNTCIADPFTGDAGVTADSGAETPDADPNSITEDVAHVPPAAEFASAIDLVVYADTTIDTESMLIDGATAPNGITFETSPQSGIGPVLAILHLRSLTVEDGRVLRVVGTRPLVIVAGGSITLHGLLDASATRETPGPGGAATGGDGAGTAGAHAGDSTRDGAGGGASFGTAGGKGGDAGCASACADGQGVALGGQAGTTYGDSGLAVLQGGSAGGASSPTCASEPAGAGGGAVQLYAAVSITITSAGGIHAGGGGGGGGKFCVTTPGSAAGAGSGGAIFLQAPTVTVGGTLAANGGAGGSSGGLVGNSLTLGLPGADATFGNAVALGGVSVGLFSQSGGAGASSIAPAQPGVSDTSDDGSGGAGGAGAGRIGIIHGSAGTYDATGSTTSPSAVVGTY